MIDHKVHVIGQVTKFHIHIEGLGEQIHSDLIMSLKLEPISDMITKVLILTVIPYHTDLINEHDGLFREVTETDLRHVKDTAAWDVNRAIDESPLFQILLGELRDESGLSAALLTKDHDQLVGIAEL